MPDLNELRDQLSSIEQELTNLRARLKRSDARLSGLQRAGSEEADAEKEAYAGLNQTIARKTADIVSLKAALRQKEQELSAAISAFSETIPILLFPVRMETKFRPDLSPPQLWVRIYPDDIAIETHEPLLTEQEYEGGCQYFRELWRAEKNPGEDQPEDIRKAAWRALATEFGPQRAAWAVRMFVDEKGMINPDNGYITDWPEDAAADGPAFKDVNTIQLRPDSWSEAPKSYVMPDRFAIRLYRFNDLVKEAWGNPIPHPLIVGPNPYPLEESEGSLFDAESSWISDFDKAVDAGMALRIDLAPDDIDNGFTRVIALGVKASADISEKGAEYLANIIEAHHYAEGFSFVSQGTPTNNTTAEKSGLSSQDEGYSESYQVEQGLPLITGEVVDREKDGARIARALGISWELFDHIKNADRKEHKEAGDMQTALWPATWGYFLETMISQGVKLPIKDWIETIRKHFVEFVRGRCPYPAIRAGTMPYGILPTSAFSKWQWTDGELENDPLTIKVIKGLNSVLQKLHGMWKIMADDPERVPRAGGSTDPEKELIQILGMDAASIGCRVRPVTTDAYVNVLLYYLVRELGGGSLPLGLDQRVALADQKKWLEQWWKDFSDGKEECRRVLSELGWGEFPFVLHTVPWGSGYESDVPLVSDTTISDIQNLPEPPTKDSLLYSLLKHAFAVEEIKNPGDANRVRNILVRLALLSPANLEQLLCETLDLSTHRLDAWITSQATRRLDHLRTAGEALENVGIYLGAFGWLEDLKPSGGQEEGGGYIHGPSISHAATAAVLRSAYLSHAGKENAEAMAVDLTSERVRRALWLLDGMREGQTLSALLGYQFERGLHENYRGTGLELDQFISPFRNLYPLKAGKETEMQEGESEETVAARNVVDGLSLLEAWQKNEIPFGQPDKELPAVGTSEHKAVVQELDSLDETVDALGDLGLAESVYHSVMGNYDRAGALLDAVAGSGRPPEPEVIRTPRGGINLKHRAAILFTGDPADIGNWPSTPRGEAEPHLNAWAAALLGDPGKIKCRVHYTVEASETIGAADLSIGPLDFLSLCTTPAMGEATELEQRIAYIARLRMGLGKDAALRIEFQRDDYLSADEKTFPEVLELGRRALEIFSNARHLTPGDLHLPEEAETSSAVAFDDSTYDELQSRITTDDKRGARDAMEKAKDDLVAAYDADDMAAVRSAAATLSLFGVPDSVLDSATETEKQQVLEQVRYEAIKTAVNDRLKKCDEQLAAAAGAPEGIPFLMDAIKALFGRSFTALPLFNAPNKDELSRVLDAANTTTLLDGEDTWWPNLWLQQVAHTHPNVRRFETMMMLGQALSQADLNLRIGQLPYKENDRWLALPFKENDDRERTQGTSRWSRTCPSLFSPMMRTRVSS